MKKFQIQNIGQAVNNGAPAHPPINAAHPHHDFPPNSGGHFSSLSNRGRVPKDFHHPLNANKIVPIDVPSKGNR